LDKPATVFCPVLGIGPIGSQANAALEIRRIHAGENAIERDEMLQTDSINRLSTHNRIISFAIAFADYISRDLIDLRK
jgi:hypothetical protein